MEKKSFISELPCEALVRKVMGTYWRSLPERDIDGAWGVAIVSSVLDGVRSNLREISSHLGVEQDSLRDAFTRLSINGMFIRSRIYKDRKALTSKDIFSWFFYAGIASGATGNVLKKPKTRSASPAR